MNARAPSTPPPDAAARRARRPVIAYSVGNLPRFDGAFYEAARLGWEKSAEVTVPPREARSFSVPQGHFFRIVSVDEMARAAGTSGRTLARRLLRLDRLLLPLRGSHWLAVALRG